MLRCLVSSAIRTNPRVLFANVKLSIISVPSRPFTNSSIGHRSTSVSSFSADCARRAGTDWSESDHSSKKKTLLMLAATVSITSAAWLAIGYWWTKKNDESQCLISDRFKLTPHEIADWKRKRLAKPHPIEGGRVEFTVAEPLNSSVLNGTEINIHSKVKLHLPNGTLRADHKEIWLSNRGIQVACTEEGARTGLIQYALLHKQKGAFEHAVKLSSAPDSAHSQAPPFFV
ncbi:hypothetical protein PRIPAC_74239 [Pristionchus pacificus]|uniref:Uncharacterized protein n=1 Tax=Pristionchus pacificus TaxID=54126 RepID=A0A454XUS3_PRIPA|nr:hypothetical protein PRIPAC_74239 [Pristionchus pacificus]|eukprot:PDM74251.1 hypothetical protein PRIPAC_41607 [Pristionchus pacificus]